MFFFFNLLLGIVLCISGRIKMVIAVIFILILGSSPMILKVCRKQNSTSICFTALILECMNAR